MSHRHWQRGYRTEQARVRAAIEQQATADQNYTEQGSRLLELAQKAWHLFERQPGTEQRKLHGFVISNCTLTKAGLVAEFKQPFDLLRESAREALKKTPPPRVAWRAIVLFGSAWGATCEPLSGALRGTGGRDCAVQPRASP